MRAVVKKIEGKEADSVKSLRKLYCILEARLNDIKAREGLDNVKRLEEDDEREDDELEVDEQEYELEDGELVIDEEEDELEVDEQEEGEQEDGELEVDEEEDELEVDEREYEQEDGELEVECKTKDCGCKRPVGDLSEMEIEEEREEEAEEEIKSLIREEEEREKKEGRNVEEVTKFKNILKRQVEEIKMQEEDEKKGKDLAKRRRWMKSEMPTRRSNRLRRMRCIRKMCYCM